MYTATTVNGTAKSFESMQEAKRYAVSRGNGGTLVDEDLEVTYRVSRKGVEDFFNLKVIKG